MDAPRLLYSENPDQMHIWFVGGCGVFGMNVTIYAYLDKYFLVDAGLLFPPDHYLGTDCMIPDLQLFVEKHGPPEAYIITHGHEDHIGAMPFLLERWPAPVYGPPWAMELIRHKLPAESPADLRYVVPGERLVQGAVTFQWHHVNHSLPMTCSLTLESPAGRIFHSGDFKFDPTPPYEEKADFAGIAAWGQAGVDVLITDSTNAPSAGWGLSEASVEPALIAAMVGATGRIYISTFASNLWRLLTIINTAAKLQKKVAISGAGLQKTMQIALKLKLVAEDFFAGILDDKVLDHQPRSDSVVIVTGCQGEHRSTLGRMAQNSHSRWRIEAGDRVILSSRFIPGNEQAIFHMLSQFTFRGAECITTKSHPGIHVSGHAHMEEISWLVDHLKPRNYIPVHGTHLQLTANQGLGAGKAAVIKVENGSLLKLVGGEITSQGTFVLPHLFVDSWSKIPLPFNILRQRLKIGDSGLIYLRGIYSRQEALWASPCQIELIGTALPFRTDEDLWRRNVIHLIEKTILEAISSDEDEVLESIVTAVKRRAIQTHIKKPVVIAGIFFAKGTAHAMDP